MEEESKQAEQDSLERKKRKGGSYVWKFCDKLSRHSVRCKLCTKVMSFHGTANVITHLQRKHNIMGRSALHKTDEKSIDNGIVNHDSNASESLPENTVATDEHSEDTKGRKRSTCSASLVWKYCTRIGRDVVRCTICKKNLSNQGTSNLQRHLHRMHGIVMQNRSESHENNIDLKNEQLNNLNQDFVWLHCSSLDTDNLKCNMCTSVFDKNNTTDIIKHLTVTHGISQRKKRNTTLRSYAEMGSTEDDDDDEDFDYESTKYENAAHLIDYDDNGMKTEVELYNDIALEAENETNKQFVAEEHFETILQNPLSPHSSRADSTELNDRHGVDNVQTSKKLNRLKEERIRVEIEYFREKAGFYRMQKYLTALQAKKVRAELAQINQHNGADNATIVDATSTKHTGL